MQDYILELAEKNDIVITLHHAMIFNRDFRAKVLDNGHIVDNRKDFFKEYMKVCKGVDVF